MKKQRPSKTAVDLKKRLQSANTLHTRLRHELSKLEADLAKVIAKEDRKQIAALRNRLQR